MSKPFPNESIAEILKRQGLPDDPKEQIYDDLLEAGFDEDMIEELDMVDRVYFEEADHEELWELQAAMLQDLHEIMEDAFGG